LIFLFSQNFTIANYLHAYFLYDLCFQSVLNSILINAGQYRLMTTGSLLDAVYSDTELKAAQEAENKKTDALHQKAIKFIKKICPFGK